MNRLGTLFALIFALVIAPATSMAGDFAQFRILGFSPDADVFAFEEFGITDGAGFPYSNIFFINTQADEYLPGTPIRVRLEEAETLAQARAQSMAKAAALMQEHRIAENPGAILAFNPVSEVGVNPHEMTYRTALIDPPFGGPSTIKLESIPFPAPSDCEALTDSYQGFRLTQTLENGEPVDGLLYADKSVPKSRGCVKGYRLGAIISAAGNPGMFVAMVEIQTFGFEGNDGRWIAVPVPML